MSVANGSDSRIWLNIGLIVLTWYHFPYSVMKRLLEIDCESFLRNRMGEETGDRAHSLGRGPGRELNP